MLVAIGVLGNVEGLFADTVKVEIVKNHIKVDPKNGYVTSVPGIYAVGDVIGPPWLAHVAHHEAVCCIETALRSLRSNRRLLDDPRLHLHRAGRGQRGHDGEGGPSGRPRGPDRQVPVPVQRPGPGRRRDRGLRQARLRRQVRRAPGRPPDRLAGHRADQPSWSWPRSSRRPRKRSSTPCTRTRRSPKSIMEAAGQGLGESVNI